MSPADDSLLGQNLVDAREEERRARWRAHVVVSFRVGDAVAGGWHPRCSCGWSATAPSPTRRLALVEADAHVDDAAEEARKAQQHKPPHDFPPAPLVDRDTGDEA